MKKIFGAILIAAGAMIVIGVLLFSYKISKKSELDSTQRKFEVTQGQTVKQITSHLIESGIIKNDFWLRVYVWLTNNESKFIAGRFNFPEKTSIANLVDVLTTKGSKETKTIKILEGWGIRDIGMYFENQGMFQQEELTELVGLEGVDDSLNKEFYLSLAEKYPILNEKKSNKSAEGFLFPDTYQIFADASLRDVVEKMAANLAGKITPEMLQDIQKQGRNFYDVLTMASIIEAEVPHEEDRPIISDIFWSRLDSGVALQSDATLNYALGGDSPSLTYEQLEIDSPYNTYMYYGLPSTPVGNPGISAIRAAIYPADTDYFYFLSTPAGKTIFSKTLEEHNAARNKYLR